MLNVNQHKFAFSNNLRNAVFIMSHNYNYVQLLENMESKMKGTCVDGTLPKLFEGRMLVSCTFCFSLVHNWSLCLCCCIIYL